MPTQEKPLHSALLEIIQLCLKEVAERLHSGASTLARGHHQHEWERRAAFIPHLTPMAEAVSLAKSAGENPDLPAVLLADVFDFHRLPRPCVPLDEIEHWRLKCGFLESGAFDLRFYVETDNVGDD